MFAPATVSFRDVAELVRTACGFEVALEFKPRPVMPVHRPYKITQVFRFLYNLGRPIGPIVHRPYVGSQLRRAFPQFRFTQIDQAVPQYVRRYAEQYAAASATRGTAPSAVGS